MLARPAGAQTSTVSGSLVDESGGVVVGATVTLAAPPTVYETVTGPGRRIPFCRRRGRGLPTLGDGRRVRSGDADCDGGRLPRRRPSIALEVGNIGEAVVVSASRAESTLLDAGDDDRLDPLRGHDNTEWRKKSQAICSAPCQAAT